MNEWTFLLREFLFIQRIPLMYGCSRPKEKSSKSHLDSIDFNMMRPWKVGFVGLPRIRRHIAGWIKWLTLPSSHGEVVEIWVCIYINTIDIKYIYIYIRLWKSCYEQVQENAGKLCRSKNSASLPEYTTICFVWLVYVCMLHKRNLLDAPTLSMAWTLTQFALPPSLSIHSLEVFHLSPSKRKPRKIARDIFL